MTTQKPGTSTLDMRTSPPTATWSVLWVLSAEAKPPPLFPPTPLPQPRGSARPWMAARDSRGGLWPGEPQNTSMRNGQRSDASKPSQGNSTNLPEIFPPLNARNVSLLGSLAELQRGAAVRVIASGPLTTDNHGKAWSPRLFGVALVASGQRASENRRSLAVSPVTASGRPQRPLQPSLRARKPSAHGGTLTGHHRESRRLRHGYGHVHCGTTRYK